MFYKYSDRMIGDAHRYPYEAIMVKFRVERLAACLKDPSLRARRVQRSYPTYGAPRDRTNSPRRILTASDTKPHRDANDQNCSVETGSYS